MSKISSNTTISQKHTLRQTPQQFMVASLIQASTEELQKIIDEELEKNIMLETDETRSVDEMREELEHETDSDESFDSDYNEFSQDDEIDGQEDWKEHDTDVVKDTFGDEDDYEPVANNYNPDKEFSPITNYSSDVSFRESLKEQLKELELTSRELFLANYIIDSLEDDGYLRRQMFELKNDLAWHQNFDTTEEELTTILVEVVQANLEPAGIAARDLRECLLLQLDEMTFTETVDKAYQVLDKEFNNFKERRFEKIKSHLDYSDKDIQDIQKIIRKLNPKPGGIAASIDTIDTKAAQVRPDFIVTNEDGTLSVSLIDCRVPAVKISQDYNEMLESLKGLHSSNSNTLEKVSLGSEEDIKKGKSFIENGLRSANQFISALIQRRNTLITVMKVIVAKQQDFFFSGNIEDLRPMTLKDVADVSQLDISTISRVTNNRYVQTDFGSVALKNLFTTAVASEGGDTPAISNATLKNALKEIVDGEDKHNPYNDDALVQKLQEQGYKIARRTVVKYREALGINKSNLRKI